MRVKDDEEGKGVLFYINIYIIYIIIIPLHHSHLFHFHLLLMSTCAAQKTRRKEGRGKGGGRRGRLDVVKENGCWERKRLWKWLLEVVVEEIIGKGCGRGYGSNG